MIAGSNIPSHADLENLTAPDSAQCHILAEHICSILLRDTYTIVLTMWSVVQLVWVSMLLFVQLVQVSKATTTYESMNWHSMHGSRASEAITAALISGTTTMDGAQIGPHGAGPDPAVANGHHDHHHAHKRGWFDQWKKLLGLDTFVATAQEGLGSDRQSRRQRNPFSRGIVTNCKDFWCDPAPVFGKREIGVAILGGEIVNYARMYETPPPLKMHRSGQDNGTGGVYQSIGTDQVV